MNIDIRKNGRTFQFRIKLVFITVTALVCFWGSVWAQEKGKIIQDDPREGIHYLERDYMSRRDRISNGTTAVEGQAYMISTVRSAATEVLTFVMSKQSDLFLEITPLDNPSAVLILGSNPTSIRDMKAVWYNNDIRGPIRFWVSDVWKSQGECNNNENCPKVSFRSTQGSAHITIRKIKWRAKSVTNY